MKKELLYTEGKEGACSSGGVTRGGGDGGNGRKNDRKGAKCDKVEGERVLEWWSDGQVAYRRRWKQRNWRETTKVGSLQSKEDFTSPFMQHEILRKAICSQIDWALEIRL
ncbi:hypothetical protein LOK49_LG03G01957 [Camellia lanceoleosa]|uniref:Uncharacterized protein n=1 Tax=Camellia lanceoleosa TaxID=1840588 RepID=A0ACC0IAS0_9ERIC|nr:hypothetical protein LOK49_LG03G01957 [Camellia lanceoleosa]